MSARGARSAIASSTRNAAAILQATNPTEFDDICKVLAGFELSLQMMLTKGGNKTLVASTLDTAFREDGWREAKYEQTVKTRLIINPYRAVGERNKMERRAENTNEVHQVDNVKGRVALDVEWNAKDGNLDRDISNFRALYEAGQIDVARRAPHARHRHHREVLRLARRPGRSSRGSRCSGRG